MREHAYKAMRSATATAANAPKRRRRERRQEGKQFMPALMWRRQTARAMFFRRARAANHKTCAQTARTINGNGRQCSQPRERGRERRCLYATRPRWSQTVQDSGSRATQKRCKPTMSQSALPSSSSLPVPSFLLFLFLPFLPFLVFLSSHGGMCVCVRNAASLN